MAAVKIKQNDACKLYMEQRRESMYRFSFQYDSQQISKNIKLCQGFGNYPKKTKVFTPKKPLGLQVQALRVLGFSRGHAPITTATYIYIRTSNKQNGP